jgi:hypothetical protein
MTERSRPADPSPPQVDEGAAKASEEPEPSKDGPGSLDWWLKDGPDSPIAADIEEPEKHL